MNKCFVQVIKVEYYFKDKDVKVQGIELNLAPKVKKFVMINKDNAELMRLMGNNLLEWYNNAQIGDDIVLTTHWEKDKTFMPSDHKINIE